MLGQMTLANKLSAVILALALVGGVLSLLRSGKISPQFAVVWFLGAVGTVILVLVDPLMRGLMRLIGATNISSTMFLVGIVFLAGFSLDLLVRLSDVANKLRMVTQELGLLRNRYEELEKSVRRQDGGGISGPTSRAAQGTEG